MGILSTETDDTRSDEKQPTETDDDGPLFEGERFRISPQYLRRYLERRAERRDRE